MVKWENGLMFIHTPDRWVIKIDGFIPGAIDRDEFVHCKALCEAGQSLPITL
jgi:hypothetical protein